MLNIDRNYLGKKDTLTKVTRLFSTSLNSFQQIVVLYESNLQKEKLKNSVDKVFKDIISIIKTDNTIMTLGKISNQTFMYPIGTDKIIKIDFSKGDVRSIHIYDLTEHKSFSLSQSSKNITLATTPFKLIHGINDMDEKWKYLYN